jgi:hypothetical protein
MAKTTLLLVAAALAANVLFNIVMRRAGADYYYTSFLFQSNDRWSDFYTLLFTYQIGDVHAPYLAWSFQDHIDGLAAIARAKLGGPLNPDHMPPLSTLIAVLARHGITLVDPVVLFLGFFLLATLALAGLVNGFMRRFGGGHRWAMAALLCYPFWFAVDRGHMFSLICALALMAATWRMVQSGRIDLASLLLLAIAINLRPNVAAVPAFLILCGRAGKIRDLPLVGLATGAVLLAAMGMAHLLYPHYGWATWLHGLADYREQYVVAPVNHGYTSSLVTVLELTFGYGDWIPLACFALGALVGLATLAAGRWGRIGTAQLVFVGLALMSIVTPGFTDYHLIPYLLPPMLIAAAGGLTTERDGRRDWAVFLASITVLIPKNYAFGLDAELVPWSYQIFINPLILLAATLFILGDALSRRPPVRGATAPPRGETMVRS